MRTRYYDVSKLHLIRCIGFVIATGCSSAHVEGIADGQSPTCPAPSQRCDDACVVGTCDFAVTSVTPAASASVGSASDWVSGGTFFTLSGHGFQKGMRVFLGDGRAPVRVIGAEHATIQAPPGPAGVVDVRIELGSQTSTSRGLFEYVAASIESSAPWEKRTMSSAHADVPSLSILFDGRALVTGGYVSFSPDTTSAAGHLFSMTSGTTAPTQNLMHTERWNHVSITLLTGKTAIFGAAGVGTGACCDSLIVDIFDPSTNTFTKSAAVPAERFQGPRAVMLVDGRVLILSYMTSAAQIYDPETDSFTTVHGAPPIDYYQITGYQYLTRLRDGRVLIVLGQNRDAWLFDSDVGTFSKVGKGPAAGPDGLHTLPDGRVIAVGGSTVVDGSTSVATATVEIFDPATGEGFAPAPYTLSLPRVVSTTALERDGSILVIGGATGSFPIPYTCGTVVDDHVIAAVDQINPVSQTVTSFAPLPEPNSYLVAGTLLDGSVVAAGGALCGVGQPYPYLYFRPAPPIL